MNRPCLISFENLGVRPGLHGCGFGVRVSADAVRHAAATPLPDEGRDRLEEVLRGRAAALYPHENPRHAFRFHWHRGTWLPHVFQVPGDACDTGLPPDEIGFAVEEGLDLTYPPHNIDNPTQAFALVAVWSGWAECFAASTGFGDAPPQAAAPGTGDGMGARVAAALREAEDYLALVQGFRYGGEFVVRDLHRPPGGQVVFRAPYDESLVQERMEACRDAVRSRAAIAAMRDPTDAVLGAIHGCLPGAPTGEARRIASERWRRAVDAALGGAPEGGAGCC